MYHNYHKHSHKGNIGIQDSITKAQDYIDRAVELGHTSVFSTEHGFQGDVFELKDLIDRKNKELDDDKKLKMIIGCEFYYVDDISEKERYNNHLIVIALNDNGYRQINEAVTIAYDKGFYYRPRIDKKILLEVFNPKDVVVTTACIAGLLSREDSEKIIQELHEYFKDHFFLEVQNHNEEKQKRINKLAIKYRDKFGIKLIHANDSHYIYPKDLYYRDMYLKGKGINYPDESTFILDYPSEDVIIERYIEQGVLSNDLIKESLDSTLIFDSAEEITMINYEIKLPSISENPKQEFDDILDREWKKVSNTIDQSRKNEYIDAIEFEKNIVHETNMEDYFIIDYKIVNRAIKKYGGYLTKTGRGSAVSFYINKLLGFTEVDRLQAPVPLYPTRFMSKTRILQTKSLPDIDLNVVDQEPFIKATEDLLGKENCAWMLSYKPLQDSSAFRLWCKAIGMENDDYNEIAKNIDDYREDEKWKDIIEESKHFIGVVESVSPSPCFIEGTLVLTNNGYKEIQNIKTGDYVLTHKNRYQKVKTPMKKKTNSILELKIMGSEIIEVTKEHPFYIVSKCGRKYTKNKETNKYESVRKFTEPYWKNAEDLTKGDFIGYPVNNNSIIPKFKIEKYMNKFSKQTVEELDFTNKNLWWLIGRYLGDGWTRFQKDKNGNVSSYNIMICCNKNNEEKNEIESHLKGLFNYSIREEKTTYRIAVSNKSLYMYLQKFGKYAHGKFIPNEVVDLPVNLLKCFLEGYFSADGYMNEERGYQSCTSVSKRLILGIQQCVHKVYKQPTTIVKRKPSKSIIEGREIIGKHDVYILSYSLKPKFTQGFYKDNYMWQPFRGYKEKEYNGYVYNMSVDKDESYTINNMAVHNCSMVLYNKPIAKEIGIIRTKEGYCCLLDKNYCDKYKYLKND